MLTSKAVTVSAMNSLVVILFSVQNARGEFIVIALKCLGR